MSELENIGSRIRKLRNKEGLTQEELGKIIHHDKSTISKIETGIISPTVEVLAEIAQASNKNLSDILFDKNYILIDRKQILINRKQIENYKVDAIVDLINRFNRITTLNEYDNQKDKIILNPEEFMFTRLVDTENPLILQIDESLLDFIRSVAEAENQKQQLEENEYEIRISKALRKLHKSKSNGKVNSYCLASIEDIDSMIKKAVKKELDIRRALEKSLEEE